MTESEAWDCLVVYARQAGVTIARPMPINALRRSLAKAYQPRKATDDDRDMRRINSCIDQVEFERNRRELCGEPEPAVAKAGPPPPPKAGQPPWQVDPAEPSVIEKQDYTDLNYIRKQIYDRSARFGDVELLKAWAWDGRRFQKVVTILGNDFALEDLGRALLYFQTHGPNPSRCEAVFLTRGAGRARRFRLILLKSGRSCEDVSKYDFTFKGEPDDANLDVKINDWLKYAVEQLETDQTRW